MIKMHMQTSCRCPKRLNDSNGSTASKPGARRRLASVPYSIKLQHSIGVVETFSRAGEWHSDNETWNIQWIIRKIRRMSVFVTEIDAHEGNWTLVRLWLRVKSDGAALCTLSSWEKWLELNWITSSCDHGTASSGSAETSTMVKKPSEETLVHQRPVG